MSLLPSGAIETGGYNINNSLRLRNSASAYLSRTPASAGNRRTWTWSAWVKRGALNGGGSDMCLFNAGTTSPTYDGFRIKSDTISFFQGGAVSVNIESTQVFRDPSAWYHFVLAVDTTQATAANRVKIYVNGNQITAFSTANYPSQNAEASINNTLVHNIAAQYANTSSSAFFDGYMTDINFIDGQALTPSSFGETDTTTGVWKPKAYSGTYGTNGFYLKFSDIATTSGSNAGLGKDFSGNSNYWTTNNISVTSGTTYDAMTDVPTNTSATVANYAVLDPLDPTTSGNMTLSNANLTMTTSAANRSRLSTIYVPSGKWYAEVTFTTASGSLSGCMVGLCRSEDATSVVASYLGSSTNSYGYNQGGDKYNAGSATAYGASYTTGDIIGIAFDADAGTVTFYKNNTSQGTAFTGLSTSSLWSIGVSSGISSTSQNIVSNINFGQRPFQYSAPSGFLPLNTYNLPTPTILQGNKYMDATLYTGTGSSQSIVNAGGFSPDFVWVKNRSHNDADPYYGVHLLFNTNAGVGNRLMSQSTASEAFSSQSLTAFNSNGFSIGTDNAINYSGDAYIGWQWRGSDSSAVTNTSGSITSTVSVNTTAGFSIATFTSTGAAATVGHGLGVAPRMIIVKARNNVSGWAVYHASVGNTGALRLDTTAATSTTIDWWRDTSPTSSVFSIGANFPNAYTSVAYCWADVSGYSKAFSYTGNGSADGPFVYTGFRPKFMMMKRTDSTGDWYMVDSSRATYNQIGPGLNPNTSSAEFTLGSPTGGALDFLSNGFKWRGTYIDMNANGGTYIGIAFAENPFKVSLAR